MCRWRILIIDDREVIFNVKHRNVIDVETRLASARAALSALNSVSADLAAEVKQATTDKQLLYAKHQKIQDFNKLTVILYYCTHSHTHTHTAVSATYKHCSLTEFVLPLAF